MAAPQQILENQVIHIKRGRVSGLGFEPAFNAYFDFYLSSRYIDPPLLQLEDVTFHLFLRKNINDQNPNWKMPSFRQMTKKFRIGQHRIEAIMERLNQAKLLEKISGYRKGEDGENLPNHYILSDPLTTLDDFLLIASSGHFNRPLLPAWVSFVEEEGGYSQNGYTLYSDRLQEGVAESDTSNKLTYIKQEDIWWNEVLQFLQQQTPSVTYSNFIEGSTLESLIEGKATIKLFNPHGVDWCQRQLTSRVSRLLSIESKQPVKEIIWS